MHDDRPGKREKQLLRKKRQTEGVRWQHGQGGGIQSVETIKDLLHAGADKVSINSAAISHPTLIYESSQQFGSQCIVVAIDAKKITGSTTPSTTHPTVATDLKSQYEIYTHGGRKPTGIDAIKWAKHVTEQGAGEILLTSMDQDGKKNGYELTLTHAIRTAVNVPVIASGGAGNCDHIVDALKVADAALLASLLHFNELTIEQIKSHCSQKGIDIRELG